MIKKKGQGSGAANLVMIILLILIFWVIFMRPEDRAKLLEDEDDDDLESVLKDYNKTLLQEHIGRLDFLSRTIYEHDIPSIYLYSTISGTVIKSINPFYIKSGVFDFQNKIVNFRIEDLENTENVLLSFNAATHKGRLVISLNEEVIFENDVRTVSVEPIVLLKEDLKEENSLEFGVSSVGWSFWKTNEYDLKNIKITGDVIDVSAQESRNVFKINAIEKNNLETATLRFLADCRQNEVGLLNILVNSHNIFSGVPDCGSLSRNVFIDDVFLKSGENNVVFRTEKGNYLIDQIKVRTELKDVESLTYYFQLNDTDYGFVQDEGKRVKVILEFVDDDEDKEAVLNINGFRVSLHTSDVDEDNLYDLDITDWIRKKNNYVDILPKSTLNILELKVVLD